MELIDIPKRLVKNSKDQMKCKLVSEVHNDLGEFEMYIESRGFIVFYRPETQGVHALMDYTRTRPFRVKIDADCGIKYFRDDKNIRFRQEGPPKDVDVYFSTFEDFDVARDVVFRFEAAVSTEAYSTSPSTGSEDDGLERQFKGIRVMAAEGEDSDPDDVTSYHHNYKLRNVKTHDTNNSGGPSNSPSSS